MKQWTETHYKSLFLLAVRNSPHILCNQCILSSGLQSILHSIYRVTSSYTCNEIYIYRLRSLYKVGNVNIGVSYAHDEYNISQMTVYLHTETDLAGSEGTFQFILSFLPHYYFAMIAWQHCEPKHSVIFIFLRKHVQSRQFKFMYTLYHQANIIRLIRWWKLVVSGLLYSPKRHSFVIRKCFALSACFCCILLFKLCSLTI